MRIICTQENLNKGLNIVSRLVGPNINLPILGNILLETNRGQVRLATTNLETGINCFVRAKVLEKGSITVPSSLITNYVNSLVEEKITLKTDKEKLLITTKYDEAEIQGLSSSDFPFQYKLVSKMRKGKIYKVEESNLKQGLTRTSFAATQDELRPEIAGTFFGVKGSTLTLVATDSYRLAEKKVKLKEKAGENIKAIVPIKAVQELLHFLEEGDGEVKIFLSEGQLLFEVRNIDFTTRLVEGQYPDYKQIIPQNFTTEVLVDLDKLSQVIKRASFFTASETNDIKIIIDSKKNEILVSAETSQAGRNESRLEAKVRGRSQEVVYNYRYFLDGLSNISGDKVSFKTSGQEEPGVMQPDGKDSFLYLIMPIRS